MPSLMSRFFHLYLRINRVKHGVRNLGSTITTRGPMRARPRRRIRESYSVVTEEQNGHIIYTLRPPSMGSGQHVLYLHGGGYVHGFARAHWEFMGRLIDSLNCTVVAPDYPLAPQHHAEDVFAMLVPLYRQLLTHVPPDQLIIMGDSAGGGMGLALAQQLRDEGLPQPAHIVLLSPWLDVSLNHPDIPSIDRLDPFLCAEGLRATGKMYAGNLDLHHPLVSPIYGDLKGLGPITVLAGSRDILVADARRLQSLAQEKGIALDYREYKGMAHVWMLVNMPEAAHALRTLAEVLRHSYRQQR